MFTLKYSRAEDVATTIKEVFRDLLSSKDKDFDSRGGEKQENSQSRNFYRILGGGSDDDAKTTKVRASFEGALSVGVDKVANAVVVSAQEEWMPTIAQMIEFLDEGAAPQTTVAVHRIPGHMNASALRKTLQDVLGQPWVGNRRPSATKESQSQPAQPQGENGSPALSPPAAKPSP
jgi:type II secretory pathway component GspD/PulD (secretin)